MHPLAVESARRARAASRTRSPSSTRSRRRSTRSSSWRSTRGRRGDLPRGGRPAARDRDRRGPPPHACPAAAARSGWPADWGRRPQRDATCPDRQQTIPATIDWSLQLLGPAEQRLFARFPVFHGAVPLEAVEAVWAGRRRGRPAQRAGGPQPGAAYDRLPQRAALRDARARAGPRRPAGRRRTARPPGPPTRRTSRPGSTTSTSAGGPTRPTAGSTTSARCCRRCGRRTRGRRARATCR